MRRGWHIATPDNGATAFRSGRTRFHRTEEIVEPVGGTGQIPITTAMTLQGRRSAAAVTLGLLENVDHNGYRRRATGN